MSDRSRIVRRVENRQAAEPPDTPARALGFDSGFGSPRWLLNGPPLARC